jgi:hypothetical protein
MRMVPILPGHSYHLIRSLCSAKLSYMSLQNCDYALLTPLLLLLKQSLPFLQTFEPVLNDTITPTSCGLLLEPVVFVTLLTCSTGSM